MTVISNLKNGYIISVKERLEEFIIRGSFPITQATWFIDNVLSTSNDTNDGLTLATALRTVDGFNAKTTYGEFRQPTEVFVSGDHTDENFQAYYTMVEGANLAVIGTSATTVATETITTITAISGNLATEITVTGFDWSTHIGRRIRFTDGVAAGSVCFIAAADPESAGTDVVRVTRIGNTTDFNPSPAYANPSDGDSFVIETLTTIGGIDIQILQGNPASGLLLERTVQFSDFDTTPTTDRTRVTPHVNIILTRCIVGSELQGPGRLDMSLCHWTGVVAGFGGLNSVFRGCLITSSFASVFIQALEEISFIDSVFQGASFICRVRAANVDDCGFFDIPIAIQVNVNSSVILRDAIFGSGITDVAIQIANAGGGSTFEITPTLTGTAGDTRIGGSVFAYGVLPTIPTLGAGLYPE